LPTTLICTGSPIGLGIMAAEISKIVNSVDSVIFIDYPQYKDHLEFENISVITRSALGRQSELKPVMEILTREPDRKFLYLETSWGLSKFTPYSRNYYLPMWEQESWKEEARNCGNFISITKHGLKIFRSQGISARYLPFPVAGNLKIEPRKHLRRILHNGGSFGGNFRKGTLEAIRIFQDSNIVEFGVELVITSLAYPPQEVINTINLNPVGITIDPTQKISWRENYKEIDLLLFPSRVEGHALAVIEAASLGIPALVTDTPPINEYDEDERFKIPIKGFHSSRADIDIAGGARKLLSLLQVDWEDKSSEVFFKYKNNQSWQVLSNYYETLLK